jgi:hypothetical protein
LPWRRRSRRRSRHRKAAEFSHICHAPSADPHRRASRVCGGHPYHEPVSARTSSSRIRCECVAPGCRLGCSTRLEADDFQRSVTTTSRRSSGAEPPCGTRLAETKALAAKRQARLAPSCSVVRTGTGAESARAGRFRVLIRSTWRRLRKSNLVAPASQVVARTRWIAPIIRSNSARSAASCRRPAAVSL